MHKSSVNDLKWIWTKKNNTHKWKENQIHREFHEQCFCFAYCFARSTLFFSFRTINFRSRVKHASHFTQATFSVLNVNKYRFWLWKHSVILVVSLNILFAAWKLSVCLISIFSHEKPQSAGGWRFSNCVFFLNNSIDRISALLDYFLLLLVLFSTKYFR